MAEPPIRLVSALEDRYRIERELGAGGMATVYLAHDLRHDRKVALKVMRPELTSILGPQRFLTEIRTTAQLHHPNVLPLFDSGEVDGLLYYVMPYVEGESLAHRLARDRQLPVDEAVKIARDVANALDYVHSHEVIHRDIKPANILLQDGRALVADFGIARAVSAGGADKLTATGIAIGTPEYASPEQSTGEAVDARTDVYSLGCVLFEMLAGEPPHTAASPQALLAKRLQEAVPRVSVLRTTVPEAIERALERALARAPADRFPTAGSFAQALQEGSSAPSSIPTARRSPPLAAVAVVVLLLAVLAGYAARLAIASRGNLDPELVAVPPFRVVSSDSAYAYLQEGGVDLLSARLTGAGTLRTVDARTILSRWRRAVAETGGELDVEQALELAADVGAGRVYLAEMVITPSGSTHNARLLRVPDGRLIAEHSENVAPGEIDEVALVDRVLGRILAISAGERAPVIPHLSDSITAVKAYLMARQKQRRLEYPAAMNLYAEALAIDTAFAIAAYQRALASLDGGSVTEAFARAWALREGLPAEYAPRLTAVLGPNYPDASTWRERIAAAERAARLRTAGPEDFNLLGWYLLLFGSSADVEDWLPRGVIALDSAIALDSTYVEAIRERLFGAQLVRDTASVRRLAPVLFELSPGGNVSKVHRWLAAQTLGDSAALAAVGRELGDPPQGGFLQAVFLSLLVGRPLHELDVLLTARLGQPSLTQQDRCQALQALVILSLARGQPERSDGLTSISGAAGCPFLPLRLVTLLIAEPSYAPVLERHASRLPPDTVSTASASARGQVCAWELWRALHHDTTGARSAVARLEELTRGASPTWVPQVGRLNVCARLIEAAVEVESGTFAGPALARLEELLEQGTEWEYPAGANLLLARWLEARGDIAGALAAVRRQPRGWNDFTLMVPGALREEGRLAAAVGDTAGAVRAYTHFLTLRDQPDEGPVGDEVARARAELAALTRGRP